MKKTLLIVLPLLLISFSCSQEPINYNTTLIEKGQLYYTKDTNQPYSGPVFSLYENGKKKEEGSLKDGKMISKTEWEYNRNGQKSYEGTYKNGKKDGLFTWWYGNGKKWKEGTWKDGEIRWTKWIWYKNGQKKYEETYKGKDVYGDPIKDGLETKWYENGQKSYEGTFKDGEYDGLWTMWYDNGHKKDETTYKDGKLISSKEWNEDGSVKE